MFYSNSGLRPVSIEARNHGSKVVARRVGTGVVDHNVRQYHNKWVVTNGGSRAHKWEWPKPKGSP